MNRTLRTAVLLALATGFAATPALAQKKAAPAEKAEKADSGSAYATVNGKAIPKYRADAMLASQPPQAQADDNLKQAIREELVRREILSQEAVKKGLDKKMEIIGQMDLARQTVLINAYLGEFVRANPVTDEAIKKEFDTIKARLGDKEYKARHILVEKEDEAKALIEKLKKGEKIEDLAKDSKDPGSKERGGDLGWANPAAYVKPFSDAMVKLAKGKFTEAPVKSDFGWHVILLEDTRELKLPSFDEAKSQISQQLHQRMVQQHIEDLRGKAKVQ